MPTPPPAATISEATDISQLEGGRFKIIFHYFISYLPDGNELIIEAATDQGFADIRRTMTLSSKDKSVVLVIQDPGVEAVGIRLVTRDPSTGIQTPSHAFRVKLEPAPEPTRNP